MSKNKSRSHRGKVGPSGRSPKPRRRSAAFRFWKNVNAALAKIDEATAARAANTQ